MHLTLARTIQERGPLTVAAFMEFALYDPDHGYYARAARRTGRAGDFFTSVDVGPLFGRLLGSQIAELVRLLGSAAGIQNSESGIRHSFDIVEAAAGNGRLSADILGALSTDHPDLYEHLRLHLVERSDTARAAQVATLGRHAYRVASSSPDVPVFEGVLIANELLDALPVHQVVMREQELREVFVEPGSLRDAGQLRTVEGPLSTPELAAYLARVGVTLQPGWRAEINLQAVTWIRDAARRLRRGFILLFDYGHPASELYSATHSAGTLTSYSRHHSAGPEAAGTQPAWLQHPGDQDLTAHVDFTSVRQTAEQEGCITLGFMDQTYFLMGVLGRLGSIEQLGPKDRLALKTLIMPGGLGSTIKVMVLGKGVGEPRLACCSAGFRLT